MATDVDLVLPPFLKVAPAADWYACQSAIGYLVFGQSQSTYPVALNDPNGLINGSLLAVENDDGQFYLPSGTPLLVGRPQDAFDGHYELLAVGQPCPPAGSGSEGSGSGSEGSGSGSGTPCVPVPAYQQRWPGYDPSENQVYGQVGGCQQWITTASCGSGSGGGGSGTLNSVLAAGNDAGGKTIVNLAGIGSPAGNLAITGGVQTGPAPSPSTYVENGGLAISINSSNSVPASQTAVVMDDTAGNGPLLYFHISGVSTAIFGAYSGLIVMRDDTIGVNVLYSSVGSGGASTQNNTLDDGSGNVALAGKINAANLPQGTAVSPPAGLNPGDFWIDTTGGGSGSPLNTLRVQL